MKVTILQGLPASGKSTLAKEITEKNKNTVRVNRDDLRNMRGQYWIPEQEDMITQWEDFCVVSALKEGKNVILDATNLSDKRNASRIKTWKESVPTLSTEFVTVDTDVDECIRRDKQRPNGVGKDVILGMYNKYLKPNVEYVGDEWLTNCIICDIDGTLAKMNGRSPFDWDRVGEDSVNVPVKRILDAFETTHTILLFSGRDEVCLPETSSWLIENEIPHYDLHMRPKGNTEDDRIVKRQMFEDVVRGKYYCDFVLDDRDKVVRMWREELGLTCLQVDYGNF